jgi:hypothetical protein
VKSDRAVPRKGSDAETVDFVPDERRKRELREAVARAAAASSTATVLSPGETVMDLNLSPAPKPEREETFPAAAVDSPRPDETIELPEDGIPAEPISAVDTDDDDDDVVELPAADEKAHAASDSDAGFKEFLSNLGR